MKARPLVRHEVAGQVWTDPIWYPESFYDAKGKVGSNMEKSSSSSTISSGSLERETERLDVRRP